MKAEVVHAAFLKSGKTLALAESCTGGALAAILTAIPDASKFLLGSIVAYSNEWKMEFLGVSASTLQAKGAVSAETVGEMVQGLFSRTKCDIAAAVSGIAGPSGGTPEKPVGTVFIAVAKRDEKVIVRQIQLSGSRMEICSSAVQSVLQALYDLLTSR